MLWHHPYRSVSFLPPSFCADSFIRSETRERPNMYRQRGIYHIYGTSYVFSPSKGRGGNQTPRSESVFITGSQPLPSPSSSFGSGPMLDKWAFTMSKIDDNTAPVEKAGVRTFHYQTRSLSRSKLRWEMYHLIPGLVM
jgi:hypothetical protein